jgi:succinate-semialdehyde dehydrogenase/glutarate-semialdehyde dehydrogenase
LETRWTRKLISALWQKKSSSIGLEKILKDAKKKGVKLHVHGKVPKKGFFFRPALVPAAGNDVKVLNMEIFGPIASVIVAKDENDVVKIANSTDLVLRAEIWSEDRKRARELAKRIRAGFVTINGRTEADPGPLFGKVNKSCLLSELSYSKLKQFVNTKTIVVHK